MAKKVILSSPLLLETGLWKMEEITLTEAQAFAEGAENFCGHETVKIIGIDPKQARKVCEGYDQALSLKPIGRLEFGKEYSREEIEKIGIRFFLISRTEEVLLDSVV